MKNLRSSIILVTLLSGMALQTQAAVLVFMPADTTGAPKNWFLLDPETDHVQGLSVDKTYSTLLAGKPSKTVLVAVIDSGIDTEHEDLKNILWVNDGEIPGNGIDDDKNGYVDDIHGWNFIGGKNGNVNDDTSEVTREYKRLKAKFGTIEEKKVSKKDKAEYELWKKVKVKYERDAKYNLGQFNEYNQQYESILAGFKTVLLYERVVKKQLNTDAPITKEMLQVMDTPTDSVANARATLIKVLEQVGDAPDLGALIERFSDYLDFLKEGLDHFYAAVQYSYNLDYDSRAIIGDNYSDLSEKYYGNNDVTGGNAFHGTHVAGIIGADRKNNKGIQGIADNVRIMSVRVVPSGGDERDKDIANGIIYATDNGAKVINMSFGKSFSPNKEVVDKAVKYAESKGVLLIHAAGNDGDDNDTDENFPNRYYKDGKESSTWLEIGASAWGKGNDFVASFSNYGKKSVDLFAPGVQIYSTAPHNEYKDADGTSMASPATTGVAALLLSYFPELTPAQVKDILRKSTRKFDGMDVLKPGTHDEVKFSELSSTGGLINAYEAVKLAMTVKGTAVEK